MFLVFPLMLVSLAIPPSTLPHHCHSSTDIQDPGSFGRFLSPPIPSILLGNIKVLIGKPSKLGLRVAWVQCCEVPPLCFSYPHPPPHP